MEKKMKKTILYGLCSALLLSACASNNYNTYDNRSYNEKQIDSAISSEMNSLSDKDIAQLNTLK